MLILWGLGTFIVGSVPWGYVVAHLRYQTDIRQHGSQNIGATNVARTLGIKAGIFVLILDAIKIPPPPGSGSIAHSYRNYACSWG